MTRSKQLIYTKTKLQIFFLAGGVIVSMLPLLLHCPFLFIRLESRLFLRLSLPYLCLLAFQYCCQSLVPRLGYKSHGMPPRHPLGFVSPSKFVFFSQYFQFCVCLMYTTQGFEMNVVGGRGGTKGHLLHLSSYKNPFKFLFQYDCLNNLYNHLLILLQRCAISHHTISQIVPSNLVRLHLKI